MLYIDIHTHRAIGSSDIISIQNYVFGEDKINTDQVFSVGIHPWYLHQDIKAFENTLQRLQHNPNFVAIGECGLDFQARYLHVFPPHEQQNVFEKHILWAQQFNKPLIIHCVKCFDKLLYLKKQFDVSVPWIVHGYAKNENLARQLLQAGFYLSFGTAIFNSKANRKALQITPLNRLFFETDVQNFYDIKKIYAEASIIKNVSKDELCHSIYQNFNHIFISRK